MGERIGNSIFLKTIDMHMILVADQDQANFNAYVRLTMVRFKNEFSGAVPWLAATTPFVWCPIDHWFTHTNADFRTVWDRRRQLIPYFNGQERSTFVRKRFRVNKTIRWQNNAQTNPDANEYALWVVTNATVTYRPLYNLIFVLRYHDA